MIETDIAESVVVSASASGIERDGDFHNALDDCPGCCSNPEKVPAAACPLASQREFSITALPKFRFPDPAAQLTAALLNNTDTETLRSI